MTIQACKSCGILVLFVVSCAIALENDANLNQNLPSAPLPNNGAAVDEVVVESSLYIKPKPRPSMRRARSVSNVVLGALIRNKRSPQRGRQQFQQRPQPGDYSQSQAVSNAAANNFQFNPFGGFNAAAANAQAQAFESKGAAGSFGASSAGSLTQAQNSNGFGLQNSAGASHSQTFKLPNGQSINFASTNSFANGPFGNNANSRGGAVSVGQG